MSQTETTAFSPQCEGEYDEASDTYDIGVVTYNPLGNDLVADS